ncbi:MAG: hypothetical protein AB1758_12285 [Candidatus Eremiobacterota bacterium]
MSEEWIPRWRATLAQELAGTPPGPRADLASWRWQPGDVSLLAPVKVLDDLAAALAAIRPPGDALSKALLAVPTRSDRLRFALEEAFELEQDPVRQEQLAAFAQDLRASTEQRGGVLAEAAETARGLTDLGHALSGRASLWSEQLRELLGRLAQTPPDRAGAAGLATAMIAELDHAWDGMLGLVRP